ncbi:MAG TPA: hypothetical protein VF926_06810 [Mycobacterium sp.]
MPDSSWLAFNSTPCLVYHLVYKSNQRSAFVLFDTFSLGSLTLRNRMVMAPMTRNRAIGNVPNDLMATYYAQRAGIGLIVTEGVSPSPNGLGYARIRGIFTAEHVKGWQKTTSAVHDRCGRIFVQLMHTGRPRTSTTCRPVLAWSRPSRRRSPLSL